MKYLRYTSDLVIYFKVDSDPVAIYVGEFLCIQKKRINFLNKQAATSTLEFLEHLFYGIDEVILRIEDGPILNTIAIKKARNRMMQSQIIDLPKDNEILK